MNTDGLLQSSSEFRSCAATKCRCNSALSFLLSSLSVEYFTKSQNIKGEGVIAQQFIPYIGLNIDYFRSNTIKIICIHIHQ